MGVALALVAGTAVAWYFALQARASETLARRHLYAAQLNLAQAAWQDGRPDADFDGSFVRRFATLVRSGDIVILRAGTSVIKAVGIMAGDYQFFRQIRNNAFGSTVAYRRDALIERRHLCNFHRIRSLRKIFPNVKPVVVLISANGIPFCPRS